MTGRPPIQVNLRKSHPALYRVIMTVGVGFIALALNFWTSSPTFNPYGWHKNIIGAVFFVLGAAHLVFLNLVRRLRIIRLVLAVSISWTLFWCASNTQQFFAGKASLQLPILLGIVATLQIWLQLESPVNPMTRKK